MDSPTVIEEKVTNTKSKLCGKNIERMCKKVDQIQSKYGVPPADRQNYSDDLISSEFNSIWEHVFHFQHNVLRALFTLLEALGQEPCGRPLRLHG